MSTVAVIIATRGRPAMVRLLVDALAGQSRPADRILVVGQHPDDVASLDPQMPALTVLVGRPGLPRQRNDGLAALAGGADIVVFFDDDFLPSRFWLEHADAAFAAHPELAGLTGRVLADGIAGPGLGWDEAAEAVAREDAAAPPARGLDERFGPYGCNMAFRLSAIGDLAFDERLPLYAWLEDSDFGGQIARRGGRTARAEALWGVHLGNKTGRERGVRLGYSQVANAVYLTRKGTIAADFAGRLALKNIAANLFRALVPEPHVDRVGRLKGNVIALADLATGRLVPERIASL